MPLVARSYQYTMEDFDDLCVSLDLSLPLLREEISQLSVGDITQAVYNKHPFLHEICKNKNVTLEMVEYVLGVFPGVASWKTDALDYKKRTEAYPLHYACWNEHCPDSVIKLLLEQYAAAINQLSIVETGVLAGNVKGLPLHYYMARTSNIDIDIVKLLVEAYPQSLMIADETWPCYPIHVAAQNDSNPDDMLGIIEYLLALRVLEVLHFTWLARMRERIYQWLNFFSTLGQRLYVYLDTVAGFLSIIFAVIKC